MFKRPALLGRGGMIFPSVSSGKNAQTPAVDNTVRAGGVGAF